MAEFGLNTETIGGAAGVIIILAIIIWVSRFSSERRALYGTDREGKLEREENLGAVAKAIRALESRLKRGEQEEKQVEGAVNQTSKREKKAAKGEKDANKAAKEEVRAVESQEEVERDTAALEGRGLGMLASVKAVMSSVANYIARVKPSMQREEQDVQALENLMRSLNNIGNFVAIDQRVANYLKQIFTSMAGVIRNSVEDEHGKEIHHGELVNKLRDVAKEASGVIKGAKTALNMLNKAKKKERRSFKNELRDISRTLNDKKRELSRMKKSKDADRAVISQLTREIRLLEQQRGFVEQLNRQLQNTYRTMDTELREMKRLIRAVTGTEKQVGRHEKAAAKREKAIGKRYSTLNKHAGELERSFENLTNPHDMAIQFSGKLSIFYDKYREVMVGDLVFDDEARKILLLHITITIQMEAYERLSISLEQAEKAVDLGLGAATEMIAAIVSGQDQKANLKNLIGEIKKAGGEIDYGTRVEMFLQQLTGRIEEEERNVNARISELGNEDKRIIEEIDKANQENSSHIGSAMATMVNRKVQIDTNYMSQARQFEQQLQSRNQIATQTYRQVRGLEARARTQEVPGHEREDLYHQKSEKELNRLQSRKVGKK